MVAGASMGHLAAPSNETVAFRCVGAAARGALHGRGDPVQPEYARAALSGTFSSEIAEDAGGLGDTARCGGEDPDDAATQRRRTVRPLLVVQPQGPGLDRRDPPPAIAA